MIYRMMLSLFMLILFLNPAGFSQDLDLKAQIDYKINKMKLALQLTDSQTSAIKPILQDYLVKKQAVLQEIANQGLVDHVAVKSTLKGLKDTEYQKLSKVLSEDQMKKWINKENLMATLNPDNAESTVDDGVSLTPSGADFKF